MWCPQERSISGSRSSRTQTRSRRNRELVRVADEGGLALVGVQDHPYQHHFFDTWSLIATLLAETKRISFFTDVANLPLRPPAGHGQGCGVARRPQRRALRARPRRRRHSRRDRELRRSAADAGRVRGGARRGDRGDQAAVVAGALGVIPRQLLPARRRAAWSTTRAPDRDLGGSVQASDAPPRGSQGRRLAAVARRAHARGAARRSTSRSTPRPRRRAGTLPRSGGSSTSRA